MAGTVRLSQLTMYGSTLASRMALIITRFLSLSLDGLAD